MKAQNKWLKIAGVVLSALFVSSGVTFAQKSHPIKIVNLMVGSQHDEPLDEVPKSLSFKGNYKGYTDVKYMGEAQVLRFNPRKTGTKTLTLHDGNGKVVIEYTLDIKKSDLTKVIYEIRSLLGEIEGISIKIVNNRVVVDGQVLLPSDMNRIYSVVQQYGAQAASIVTLSPIAQRKIASYIERDINNPEIHVRSVNERFILEGLASSQAEKDRAEVIAKMYVPDLVVEDAVAAEKIKKRSGPPVINLINIKEAGPAPPAKIIQLNVHYVELKKDYNRGFRFQWTPTLQDGSQITYKADSNSGGGVVSTITGTIENLLPKLNWAREHGFARVLQSTSLIVQDRKEGNIQSMQRIPYAMLTAQGIPQTAVEEVGIRTQITPGIIGPRSDSIELVMNFTLSSFLGKSSSGMPITSNNNIVTTVVVRSGQSAAIGGLISNTTNTDFNKLPQNNAENPLLSLYASKDFARNQSQFVVFVTPVIKASASDGAERVKEKFRLRD